MSILCTEDSWNPKICFSRVIQLTFCFHAPDFQNVKSIDWTSGIWVGFPVSLKGTVLWWTGDSNSSRGEHAVSHLSQKHGQTLKEGRKIVVLTQLPMGPLPIVLCHHINSLEMRLKEEQLCLKEAEMATLLKWEQDCFWQCFLMYAEAQQSQLGSSKFPNHKRMRTPTFHINTEDKSTEVPFYFSLLNIISASPYMDWELLLYTPTSLQWPMPQC